MLLNYGVLAVLGVWAWRSGAGWGRADPRARATPGDAR